MEFDSAALEAIKQELARYKPCLYCKRLTDNPKFCSRSCATSFNNLENPRRKPEGTCEYCGNPISKSRTYCGDCYKAYYLRSPNITVGELRKRRKYQAHSQIRDLARKVYENGNYPKQCSICGYDKHFEICHIKSISSHADEALVRDINHPSNLTALCPNHHWELDNGLVRATGVEPACVHYPSDGLEDRGDTPGE